MLVPASDDHNSSIGFRNNVEMWLIGRRNAGHLRDLDSISENTGLFGDEADGQCAAAVLKIRSV